MADQQTTGSPPEAVPAEEVSPSPPEPSPAPHPTPATDNTDAGTNTPTPVDGGLRVSQHVKNRDFWFAGAVAEEKAPYDEDEEPTRKYVQVCNLFDWWRGSLDKISRPLSTMSVIDHDHCHRECYYQKVN